MNMFIIITLCQLLLNTWKISITAPLSTVCSSSQVKGKYLRFWYVMQTWPACLSHAYVKEQEQGFPGGAVVENLPANAGDTGSCPGLGGSHMPRSNWAREPQLLSLRVWSLCSATRDATIVRGPHTAMKSGPRLPQLEKALAQKRRPNTAINKKNKNKKFKKNLKKNKKKNQEHLYNGMGTLNFFLKKWPNSDMPLQHYTPSREEYLFDWATGSTGHCFLCLNRSKVESNYLEGSKFNLYWSFVS